MKVKKMFDDMLKMDFKNFNEYSILSILFLIAGLVLWISWGLKYGIWYDISIYSITIVFVLSGVLGLIISLKDKTGEN
jgi:hypothetical protein